MKTLENNQVTCVTAPETLDGQSNGCSVLKVSITNNDASDVIIPFGTLLGLDNSTSAAFVFPNIAGAGQPWVYDAAIAPNMVDNLGASTPMLRDLNRLFIARPVVVKGFEVVTADTALGLSQRKETLTIVDYPLQFEDSRSKKGNFVPQFTEVTSSQILSKPISFGMNKGAYYKVLAGATININIFIGAHDTPSYSVQDCDC